MKKYRIVDLFDSVWNEGDYNFIYDMFMSFEKRTVLEFELRIIEV